MDDFCRTCLIFFNEKVGKYSLLKNCAVASAPGRLKLLKSVMQTFSLSLIPNDDTQVSKICICKACVIEMNNMLNFLEKCLHSNAVLKQTLFFDTENYSFKSISQGSKCSFESKAEIQAEEQDDDKNILSLNIDSIPSNIDCTITKSSPKKKKRTNCSCCEYSKKFPSALSVAYHKYKITNYQPHVCGICNKNLKSVKFFEKHMAANHKDMEFLPFKCKNCCEIFSTKNLLNQHELVRHNTKGYSCKACKRTFSTITTLKYHENIHSNPDYFFCSLCSEKFTSLTQLKDHKKLSHCKVFDYDCEQRFKRKNNSDVHNNLLYTKKEEMQNYNCTKCDKKFLNSHSLTDHMNTHLEVKPYLCSTCGTSSTFSILNSQFLGIHSEKQPAPKMYVCHNCGNSFGRASHLKRHTQHKHAPNVKKKHECLICKKKFLEKSDLKAHIKLHDDLKPYSCEQCSKCFRTSWIQQAHVNRVHLGLKPFKCPTCSVKFKTKAHLDKHIRTHTGEKPFPCSYCDYTCAEKSNLKKHINTHMESI